MRCYRGWFTRFEWQVIWWEGLLLLVLWATIQKQSRRHQLISGNQVKPLKHYYLLVAQTLFHTWIDTKRQLVFLCFWFSVHDGLCSTALMKPVQFGENSTSGCLLAVSQKDLTQCDLLRSVAQYESFRLYTKNHTVFLHVRYGIIFSFLSGKLLLICRTLWQLLHM